MTIGQTLLPEFEHEMAGVRKTIERVPEDKYGWKAHPKSNTMGWVVAHLAEIPGWVEGTLTQDIWETNPPGGEPYKSPVATSQAQILALFDQNVAAAKKALAEVSDESMYKIWSLHVSGKPVITMPRIAVMRGFILSHAIHHRAILCVYLRLNDLPVPALYGPSGDEGSFG